MTWVWKQTAKLCFHPKIGLNGALKDMTKCLYEKAESKIYE